MMAVRQHLDLEAREKDQARKQYPLAREIQTRPEQEIANSRTKNLMTQQKKWKADWDFTATIAIRYEEE